MGTLVWPAQSSLLVSATAPPRKGLPRTPQRLTMWYWHFAFSMGSATQVRIPRSAHPSETVGPENFPPSHGSPGWARTEVRVRESLEEEVMMRGEIYSQKKPIGCWLAV